MAPEPTSDSEMMTQQLGRRNPSGSFGTEVDFEVNEEEVNEEHVSTTSVTWMVKKTPMKLLSLSSLEKFQNLVRLAS
ncbi:MAG: hypothetical protein Q9177_003724 [Variospora cf. flavescens]